MCLAQWARDIGIRQSVLGRRLKRGWSIDMALTTPRLKVGQKLMPASHQRLSQKGIGKIGAIRDCSDQTSSS
jgi:hypothetical protein